MNTKLPVSETLEQLQRFLQKHLALNPGVSEESKLIDDAFHSRFGDVNPGDVLYAAQVNSLAVQRRKLLADPKSNPLIQTSAQGDLFDAVPLQVPETLMVDGKPRPYYQCSILDGLEWWLARQDAKKVEGEEYQQMANARLKESRAAAQQAEVLEGMVRTAHASGIDPKTVLYARKEA